MKQKKKKEAEKMISFSFRGGEEEGEMEGGEKRVENWREVGNCK